MMKYIHYGHTDFDRCLFLTPKNRAFNICKPIGGLWASSVDAEFGWKDWCEREHFEWCDLSESFVFTLRENAKVLRIISHSEISRLPQQHNEFGLWIELDFEQLVCDGWDAIEVIISADQQLYWDFYGWDCDSIVILNPDIVEVCER